MKKCILLMLMALSIGILGGCNWAGYDWIDTNYHFDRAIISLPDGNIVEGKIKKWTDSEDGEQLTIELEDGTRYLVSSYNCVLIEDN